MLLRRWRFNSVHSHRDGPRRHHLFLHRATLVNVKLKWVSDHPLDSVVSGQKHLPMILHLISSASSTPTQTLCTRNLTRPPLRDPTSFLRRFPALFTQLSPPSLFSLTPAAKILRHHHTLTLTLIEPDLIRRLRKLLMLARGALPLHTIDLLRFDLGLEPDYKQTLIPRYPQFFAPFRPDADERTWLRLLSWDPQLAVSALEDRHGVDKGGCLAFPVSFPRGFGLKRKCLEWLREWQTLPYTSPYAGAEGLDPRTDVAEKRMVGVFHELLHLTVGKMTERRNVSNMRRVLGLPQKFTKVFERHPGIFYMSPKLGTQTVVLREAYGSRGELIEKHPLVETRERYLELMRVRRKDMEEDVGEDDECHGEYDPAIEEQIG